MPIKAFFGQASWAIMGLLLLMLPSDVKAGAYKPALQKSSSPFGIQILEDLGDTRILSWVVESGARWVRVGIEWRMLAPQDAPPSQYLWQSFDPTLRNIGRNGLNAIVVLGGNPAWAADFNRGPINKVDLSRWAEYVHAVVQRYHVPPYNVKHWEIYNEPDAADWTGTDRKRRWAYGDHPAEYAQALKVAYETIKTIDPDAIVIFGGIAYDSFTDDPKGGFFTRTFFERALEAGAGAYFDWMNFHYYPDLDWRWGGLSQKVQTIWNIMQTRGLARPIICTEIGFSSAEAFGGSEQIQAAMVVQLLVRGAASGLPVVIWYTLADNGNTADPYGFHGLLTTNFQPKSSFAAFRLTTMELEGWRAVGRFNQAGAVSGIEGYTFVDATGRALKHVLWSNDGRPHSVLFRGVIELVTLTGERMRLGRAGETTSAAVGSLPVFVREQAALVTASPVLVATATVARTPTILPTSPSVPVATTAVAPIAIPLATSTPSSTSSAIEIATAAPASPRPVDTPSGGISITAEDSGNWLIYGIIFVLAGGSVGILIKVIRSTS